MQVSASIFKAYDIRGIVPSSLNEAVAEGLGRAFGTIARREGETTVAVGRDGRLSGPSLSAALIRGLVAAGVQVIDVGMVTTPILYFAAHTLAKSGIQITGSHNPKDYNGFKMIMGGRAIYGEEIQALRSMIEAEDWLDVPGGNVRQADVLPAYRERIVSDVKLARPLKIVIDSGNGIAGASSPAIFPDRQMALFAQDVLSRVPGGTILFDVKCSQRLAPAIEAAGGKALMFKTGHSLIKAKMKAIEAEGGQAPLGGEMSGHIFFKERWFGFDDGTYAGARLLEILSQSPDASAVLDALPTSFSTPELNVGCAEGEPHTLVAQLVAAAKFDAPAAVNTIDGLRVDWPDGFGLIRASNTTPVLVLRFEGQTEAALERIQTQMMALLRSAKPDAQIQAAAH